MTAAAAAIDAPIEVVVEVLRSRLRLGVVPVSHALGLDAAEYIRPGTRRPEELTAAADRLWASVIPRPITVPEPSIDDTWQATAACRGLDPRLWFSDEQANDDQIEAVAVCSVCPAVGHCALASLSEPAGLWGGMTERNRRRLYRYLRLGVVAATPEAVAPLAVDIALSSLQARIAMKPLTITDDGRLFEVAPSAEVAEHERSVRRRRRAAAARPEPLFEYAPSGAGGTRDARRSDGQREATSTGSRPRRRSRSLTLSGQP